MPGEEDIRRGERRGFRCPGISMAVLDVCSLPREREINQRMKQFDEY